MSKIAGIMGVIALVILTASFILPWYAMEFEFTIFGSKQEMKGDFYLDKVEMSISGDGNETDETTDYSDDDYREGNSEFVNVSDNTRMMVIGSIALTAIFTIIGFLAKPGRSSFTILIALGLITAIAVAAPPAYYMSSVPGAIDDDSEGSLSNISDDNPGTTFMGESSESGVSLKWGPQAGWALMWIAFIFVLIGLIGAVFSNRKEKKRARMADHHQQYGPYPGGPPPQGPYRDAPPHDYHQRDYGGHRPPERRDHRYDRPEDGHDRRDGRAHHRDERYDRRPPPRDDDFYDGEDDLHHRQQPRREERYYERYEDRHGPPPMDDRDRRPHHDDRRYEERRHHRGEEGYRDPEHDRRRRERY